MRMERSLDKSFECNVKLTIIDDTVEIKQIRVYFLAQRIIKNMEPFKPESRPPNLDDSDSDEEVTVKTKRRTVLESSDEDQIKNIHLVCLTQTLKLPFQ